MSKTRQAGYTCPTCSKAITFHYGSRVRYNLDGTIHLCRPDDRIAYEKYCEYLKHDKHARWIGWRLTGEDFWKWKWEVYDVGQHRNYSYDSQQQQSSNYSTYGPSSGGRLEQALEIMELGPDILETIETKEALI